MAEPNIISDGTTDFSGGQNSAVEPDMIANNQYYIGINVSAEEGSLKPRWALDQIITLDFTPAGNYTRPTGQQVSFEEVFRSGKFQALIPYSIGPDFYDLYIVSGFVYIINLQTFMVDVMNKTDPLNSNADRVNWSNAGPYLVIFDWFNVPFILLEGTIRRSRPQAPYYEVPVSVLGTHNQNRLCIANAGIDWTAGDPAGSPAAPNAPISFIEVLAPSTGYTDDVYQIPTALKNNENITAMGFLQVLDKSTGIGSLFVATPSSVTSYPTYLPRQDWQGGAAGAVFGSMLLPIGIVGQRAFTNVNSDVFFKSPERQIFAFTVARNEQARWSNSPISREVADFLNSGDPKLDFVTAAAKFKNKIFFTCNPYRVDCFSADGLPQVDIVHSGLVVIETNNLASLSNTSPPAWAGVWTGAHFMDLAENNKTLYCAAKYRNRNELFILNPEKTFDTIEGKPRDIRSVVVTKEYTNTDQTVNKKIHSVHIGLRKLKGDVTLKMEYKPSTTDNYYHWKDLTFSVPYEQCEAYPPFPNGLSTQGVRDLNLGGVDEKECLRGPQDIPAFIYKGVQLRLTITGRDWRLPYIKLRGVVVSENDYEVYCKSNPPQRVPLECFDPWFIPDKGNC